MKDPALACAKASHTKNQLTVLAETDRRGLYFSGVMPKPEYCFGSNFQGIHRTIGAGVWHAFGGVLSVGVALLS